MTIQQMKMVDINIIAEILLIHNNEHSLSVNDT